MRKINNNERLAYLAPEVLKQEFCMRCMQDVSPANSGDDFGTQKTFGGSDGWE